MVEALRNIGLSVLIPRFQNKNVNTETILKLIDGSSIELGVKKLGDRIQLKEECRKLSQKIREENANALTDGDESNNSDNNYCQELLSTKGLNYLGHIPQVMHQEEELMLRKFILDPAALPLSVAVEGLKRNQSFGMQISFAWRQCMQ